MNEQVTLQTIAEQVERVVNHVDSLKSEMAIFTNGLTRLETRIDDLKEGVGRLKAGVERLDGSVERLELTREKRQ